jgi:putative nucleotidyltransferase with HDIG domain
VSSVMKRILFVDDEPQVLEALHKLLRPQEQQWEMDFVLGGEAALKLMGTSKFDVVVTDMQMPGMDGASLLKAARERYPEVVRIVCASQRELGATLRAVPVAHQFLPKPCDIDTLRVAVGRATSLFEALNNEALTSIVGPTKNLPSLPRTYSALQGALADRNASLDKVARIVEQDIAISAKTLQLVNSALFGVRQNIATVRTAVSYLGIGILQQLILSAEVFRAFQDSERIPGFSLDDMYSHSQLTAKIAGAMHALQYAPEAPVVASLLHDVGKLVLATRIPKEFAKALAQAKEQQRPLHEVERELIGVTHAEVGAGLLGLWGLPCIVVEAVAHHHDPGRVPHPRLDALAAVHVANALAHEHSVQKKGTAATFYAPLKQEYIQEIGIADRLPQWQTVAESAAHDLAKVSL